jgi:hypothetical protein
MQAGRGAVPRDEDADHLTAAHVLARGDHGIHRFEARQQPAAVIDRQHRTIDDEPGEVHHPVVGRPDRGADRCDQIHAPVPAPVRAVGRHERTRHRMRRRHRPAPARFGGADRRESDRETQQQTKHAGSLTRAEPPRPSQEPTRGQPSSSAGGEGALLH